MVSKLKPSQRYIVEYWDEESLAGGSWSYIGDADTFTGARDIIASNQRQDRLYNDFEASYRIRYHGETIG